MLATTGPSIRKNNGIAVSLVQLLYTAALNSYVAILNVLVLNDPKFGRKYD